MRNSKKIIFGVVLLIAGVIFALNALEITNIDILFPGWWTLFIIIPCAVGLFTERDKTGNVIGLLIGVFLLLSQLDLVDISYLWKLGAPLIVIIIAVKLIVGGFRKRERRIHVELNASAEDIPEGTVIFGGKDLNYNGQPFSGGEYTAVFGGINLDLSGAIIEHSCHIDATAVFGGIDIILPKNVNLMVNSTGIFGGVENMYVSDPDASVTVSIDATGVFGGVDIR